MTFGSRKFQTRKVPALAVLGLAGFLGVAGCTAPVVAIHPLRPPARLLSPLAGPAGNDAVVRNLARIVAGNGGLAALDNGDGRATLATCDPGTVSSQPRAGTLMSASCGISYSDGSVWRQTVTVTFDIHGRPVADWTDMGTELLQPTGG